MPKVLQVACTYKFSYMFRQVFAIVSETILPFMHCVQFVTIELYGCIYELRMYLLIYINLCHRFSEVDEPIYTFHILYVRLLVYIINY
jgi:hypothetical protein